MIVSDYTAVIPVAGKGVRLLPYTQHCPKTMLYVAGRPIIAHILDQIELCGIKKVVFVVGYQKEVFIEFIQKHYSHLEVEFVEQVEQKGLGHAIYLTKDAVKGPCLIVLGNTIIDGDLRPLLQNTHVGVGVKQVADPRRFGVVEMQGENIIGFEEKPENPKSDIALIGAYSFANSQRLFDALEKVILSGKTVKNEIQLTDALSVLLEEKEWIVPVFMNNWFDCGTVEILLKTNQIFLDKASHVPDKFLMNNSITDPCWIDETAVLENCVLGPYVSVAEGSCLKDCSLQNAIVSAETKTEGKKGTSLILDKYTK